MIYEALATLCEFGKYYLSNLEQPIGSLRNIYEIFFAVCCDPVFVCRSLLVTLVALVVLSLVWVYNRKEKHSLFSYYGIPFVKPHILYGSLHELRNSSKKNELEVMEGWIQTYGKVFGYYVGFTPYLVVADLDVAKNILIKKASNYINRPQLAIKANPVIDTLVGLRNERWKEVRTMLSPAFTAAKLKQLLKTMNEKVEVLMLLIEEANSVDEQLEWLSTYQGLTLDIISSCAFAMKTNCVREQNSDPFFAAVRDFLNKAMNPAVLWAQYCPFFAIMMTFVNNYWTKSGKATRMIISNLEKAIDLRRKNANERKPDILQTILDSSEADFEEFGKGKTNKTKPLSDKEIIANSWVFLLGGYETTAAALSFTTYLLAKHPEVQEKLYKEIKENVSLDDGYVTYDDIMKLNYLDQVLNESLRMYPPVSSFLQREASEADEIEGFKIPKKTNVVIPVWHIHHNPLYWPDPYEFNPERFSSEAKADPNRNPLAFIPFGAGPRNCIGMRFGQIATKVALTRILLKYRFEASDKTPDDLTLTVQTVTLLPKEKIIIRAVERDYDHTR